VEFTADTLKLNLIDLGRTESKLITVVGHVDFMCQEVEAADPVTFTTRDSNLVSVVIEPCCLSVLLNKIFKLEICYTFINVLVILVCRSLQYDNMSVTLNLRCNLSI